MAYEIEQYINRETKLALVEQSWIDDRTFRQSRRVIESGEFQGYGILAYIAYQQIENAESVWCWGSDIGPVDFAALLVCGDSRMPTERSRYDDMRYATIKEAAWRFQQDWDRGVIGSLREAISAPAN